MGITFEIPWNRIWEKIWESNQNKTRSNLGIRPNLPDLPPFLGNLGIINCYFLIEYLGFEYHEMDLK